MRLRKSVMWEKNCETADISVGRGQMEKRVCCRKETVKREYSG